MMWLMAMLATARCIATTTGPVPDVDTFMQSVERRFPHEALYVQAVREVAESVMPYIAQHPELHAQAILLRCTEPERAVSFRVEWMTDAGEVAVNRGYRVMANGALGPMKGGLRFDKSVDIGTLHFLAFEQVLRSQCGASRCAARALE
jgi:glutamate dehydrogenase (NADP+)